MARAIRDYYRVLGVAPGADGVTIMRAYRELVDDIEDEARHIGPSEELDEARRDVEEAYAVLARSESRQAFDRLRGHTRWWLSGDVGEFDDEGESRDVPTEEAVEAALRRLLRDDPEARRGVLEFRLPFELAALGGRARVRMPIRAACPECGGLGGEMDHAARCESCGGSTERRVSCAVCEGRGWLVGSECVRCGGDGWVPALGTVDLEVPPGVTDGTLLPFPGFRQSDTTKPLPHIRVKVSSHPYFTRVGRNIHCEVPISRRLAERGSTIRVKTLRGKRQAVTIPPNTRDGTVLKLKGEGIDADGQRGDQIVEIRIRRRDDRKTGGKK